MDGITVRDYLSRGHRNITDPADPTARHREYDDKRFCLDHFQTKLLSLADGFQTPTGQRLAQARHHRLKGFMETFIEEIGAL